MDRQLSRYLNSIIFIMGMIVGLLMSIVWVSLDNPEFVYVVATSLLAAIIAAGIAWLIARDV